MGAPQSAPETSCAVLDGDAPPLINPGVYDLRFDWHATAIMFGRAPKLVLAFTIIEIGSEYFDRIQLHRYYNIIRLIGKPAKRGSFKVGFRSEFLREYCRLFPTPGRLDRIPMSAFERVIVRGRVRTVTTGSDQRDIPDSLQYSVIDELLEVKQP